VKELVSFYAKLHIEMPEVKVPSFGTSLVQEAEPIRWCIYENICSTYLAAMVFVSLESIEVGRSVVVRMGEWFSIPRSLTW